METPRVDHRQAAAIGRVHLFRAVGSETPAAAMMSFTDVGS
ncbi:hypothetical protein QHF83_45495 [Polyangium sp. 15x6]|nr:hypothetical protein [Polyangium sp. 15x6]